MIPPMKRERALKRAESELAEITPDRRAELLAAAKIGPAGQARALGAAFRMLEQAINAEDSVKVGKGGNGRVVKRPNWQARIMASRILLEWLAPVVRQSAAQTGRPTQVAVVLQGFAGGVPTTYAPGGAPEMMQGRAVVHPAEVGAVRLTPDDALVASRSDSDVAAGRPRAA